MSLETWKAEFYPIPASEVEEKDAVAHSLRKWRGLTRENLEKHGLSKFASRYISDFDEEKFKIDADTCALCTFYLREQDQTYCDKCPLFDVLDGNCDVRYEENVKSPYVSFLENGDPEPMILALEKALAKNNPSTEINLRDESGAGGGVSRE